MEITHIPNSDLFLSLFCEPAQQVLPRPWVSVILSIKMITILIFSSLVKICSWNQQLVFCPHSVETKKDLEEIILKDNFSFLLCFWSWDGREGTLIFQTVVGRVMVDRVKGS